MIIHIHILFIFLTPLLYSWFIFTFAPGEYIKSLGLYCPETLNLAWSSLTYWQVHKSHLKLGEFYPALTQAWYLSSLPPRIGTSQY